MKYQVLFYQKNEDKIFKTVVCCSCDGALRVKCQTADDKIYVCKSLKNVLSRLYRLENSKATGQTV